MLTILLILNQPLPIFGFNLKNILSFNIIYSIMSFFFCFQTPSTSTNTQLDGPPHQTPIFYSIPFYYFSPTQNTQISSFLPNSLQFPEEQPEAIFNQAAGEQVVVHNDQVVQRRKKMKRKRQRNSEKEIESAKKNGESNLVNHLFSYFCCRQKSGEVVEGCIHQLCKNQEEKQKILYIFYHVIQQVKANQSRKYVNRVQLLPLIHPEKMKQTIPDLEQNLSRIKGFCVADLCEVYRRCVYHFYRQISINSIATSKRISSIAKLNHMERRRKINWRLFKKDE